MNEQIELITYVNGVRQFRTVFADEQDTYGDEFARAGQMGLKPKKIFLIHPHEYQNEEELRHGSKIYTVYRIGMNKKTDKRELYCEARLGSN